MMLTSFRSSTFRKSVNCAGTFSPFVNCFAAAAVRALIDVAHRHDVAEPAGALRVAAALAAAADERDTRTIVGRRDRREPAEKPTVRAPRTTAATLLLPRSPRSL